jgi:type IV pilus assembly protein PilM
VAISFRILSPNTNTRPKLACEITPDGVIAARQQGEQQATMSFVPLQAGIVKPGLGEANFTDQSAVVLALQKALGEVAPREKQLTLVVPDAAVRVVMVDFDALPAKAQEALPIVRFRLRKLMPFEVDDAAVSYQVMRQGQGEEHGQTHVLVTVMPAAVRDEYEGAVRAAGFEPGVVLPSTLAALAALTTSEAALVVNRNGLSLTTAITAGDELLLHRTQELPVDSQFHQEEVVQSVSVARAYFEDTLKLPPQVVYYVGPGGAQEFAHLLEDGSGTETEDGLRVRDLVAAPAMGASGTMPKGLAAGVTGALAS